MGAELFHEDGWTYMTKLIAAFHNSHCKIPEQRLKDSTQADTVMSGLWLDLVWKQSFYNFLLLAGKRLA